GSGQRRRRRDGLPEQGAGPHGPDRVAVSGAAVRAAVGDRRTGRPAAADTRHGALRALRPRRRHDAHARRAALRAPLHDDRGDRRGRGGEGGGVSDDFDQDEWGYAPGYVRRWQPLLDQVYDRWWRVQAIGVENIPSRGRALIVANHAGVLP